MVRNLVFENLTDESRQETPSTCGSERPRIRCQTGYRSERGSFDGLYFLNVRSLGGKFSLKGLTQIISLTNVTMAECYIGDNLLKNRQAIQANEFVEEPRFLSDSSQVAITPLATRPKRQTSSVSSPDEFILDDSDPGFRSYGFTRSAKPATPTEAASHRPGGGRVWKVCCSNLRAQPRRQL